MSKHVLYDDGEKILLQRPNELLSDNRFVEQAKSPLTLISEADQRYAAHIEEYLSEDTRELEPRLELRVNPSSIQYYLEPGDVGQIKRNIDGEIRVNGDSYPVNVRFESEMYEGEMDVFVYSNFQDPRIEALAGESATVKMDENPVENVFNPQKNMAF
ncbi:MAG: hypothetical protein H8Z69_03690 [Nanohaloarchaea archaeon]|nr:hypothetical protein [Candidatus Nanohaloarchaea archaeon]